MQNGNNTKINELAKPVILALTSFLFFQLYYPYHLFLKEQVQLFLFSSDYFFSYFKKPGWLACYTGDFLTQFFYLRSGGPIIISFLLFLEWALCFFLLKKITGSPVASLWALLPAITDWILYSSLIHRVALSTGLIIFLVIACFYFSISAIRIRTAFGIILTLTGYWLAGSLFFFFPALILTGEWTKGSSSQITGIILVALSLALPALMRINYLLTLPQAYFYPGTSLKDMFLPAAVIICVLLPIILIKYKFNRPGLFPLYLSIGLFILLITGIWQNANFRLEKILSLDSETYFSHPGRVIKLSEKYRMNNRMATYFTNMALAKTGQLPQRLLDFYQPASLGLILPVTPDEGWLSVLSSNELFFLIGDMNFAQHSAMLGNTFSPEQRSSRMIRRLAEINLINGDKPAAEKYLRLLEQTLFHRQWAKKLFCTPKQFSELETEKQTCINSPDTLLQANDYLTSLHFLVEQNPDNMPALDYLLCYYLLQKNLESFKKTYDRYALASNRPIPTVYSQAILIQLFREQASPDQLKKYKIPQQEISRFALYTKQYGQTGGNMDILKKNFGKTYWFYYHFATMKTKGGT